MKFFKILFVIFVSIQICLSANHKCTPSITDSWGPYLQQVTEPFDDALLEGPFWHPENHILYFVNLHQGKVMSFNPDNKEINFVKLGHGDATVVLPTRKENRYLVGFNKTLVLLSWNGKTEDENTQQNILSNVEAEKDGNRFNDGKTDVKGRAWIGTMGYEDATGVRPDQGTLYKFEKVLAQTKGRKSQIKSTKEISPVSISNGMAWTNDQKKFYYIDTPTRKIASYDFDAEKGTISNRQIVFDLENYDIGGNPDGMTIDENDNLFIALYNGGAVIKVDPHTGTLLQKIAIPAERVTSVMFGGKDLDILFVTTSRFGLTEEQMKSQPAAGSLFAITNVGKGRNMTLANF